MAVRIRKISRKVQSKLNSLRGHRAKLAAIAGGISGTDISGFS
jgi:hypothetical protein